MRRVRQVQHPSGERLDVESRECPRFELDAFLGPDQQTIRQRIEVDRLRAPAGTIHPLGAEADAIARLRKHQRARSTPRSCASASEAAFPLLERCATSAKSTPPTKVIRSSIFRVAHTMIQGKAMPSVSAVPSTEPTRIANMSPAVKSLFPRAPMKDVCESTKRFILA